MVIRRLLDRLTGALQWIAWQRGNRPCPVCRAWVLSDQMNWHIKWDHADEPIRALPADPDDGTGRSA